MVNEQSKKSPLWKGPLIDGVTQSILKAFLQCPYCFYLYAILGLKDNKPLHPNLIWGDCFHIGLESLLANKDKKLAGIRMKEHLKKYPSALDTYYFSLKSMLPLYQLNRMCEGWKSEEEFSVKRKVGRNEVIFKGKRDGLNKQHPLYGTCIAEHKCKGYIDPVQTAREIKEDLQCNLYMTVSECEWVFYDLIKIPDTQKYLPQRHPKETPGDYIEKLYTGPCPSFNEQFPIYTYSEKWVYQGAHFISEEDQSLYWKRTIEPLVMKLIEWWDYINSPEFDYQNPDCYNDLFYRMPVRFFNGRNTQNFECDYYEHLLGEEGIEELQEINTVFSELEEQ